MFQDIFFKLVAIKCYIFKEDRVIIGKGDIL
jgi:hypothetical protein